MSVLKYLEFKAELLSRAIDDIEPEDLENIKENYAFYLTQNQSKDE